MEKVSLLYVEDDPISRDLVCTALSRKHPDMELHSAENGEAGLKLYEELKPDIILTDICLPVMDGIKMAQKILARDPAAKIIAATAISDTDFMLDAIKTGISRYVLKPFDFQLLFAAVEDALDKIVLERKVRAQSDFIRQLTRAIEQSTSMVIITDATGGIEYVNSQFSSITGYAPEEIIGQNLKTRLTDITPPESLDFLWTQITCGSEWRGQFVNRKKDGEEYYEEVLISPLTTQEGNVTNFVAVMEDITDRKRAEEQIRTLIDELEQTVRVTHRRGESRHPHDLAS
ncbi:PAS domain-containing response regulator [Geomonas sp.]|uniref:PAS domain-containing response regulator n=1 Tax=Geomonas sp. TaxID=2651584 RepID=UPI002B45AC08|nr:response regulator [Geomonas sp.]HJV35802.1 response regulator [Geomonas sp.]